MIYNDNYLTTLEHVRAMLGADDLTDAGDDAKLWQLISAASALVHQYCRRSFVPFAQTRTYDARGEHIDGALLRLDDDLLEATTVTNGDSVAVSSSDYVLRKANLYPKWGVQIKDSAGLYWTYSGSDYEDAISIAGVWGFHEDYGDAWVNTGDSVQDGGGIDDSVQAITVTDADGKDARYRTRFEVGKLLKIESEFVKVVAVNTTTNALTVLRGANGSTAAAHDASTAICTWAVQRNIEQAVIAITRWLYRHKSTDGDRIQFMDGTQVILNEAPIHIQLTLKPYMRIRL